MFCSAKVSALCPLLRLCRWGQPCSAVLKYCGVLSVLWSDTVVGCCSGYLELPEVFKFGAISAVRSQLLLLIIILYSVLWSHTVSGLLQRGTWSCRRCSSLGRSRPCHSQLLLLIIILYSVLWFHIVVGCCSGVPGAAGGVQVWGHLSRAEYHHLGGRLRSVVEDERPLLSTLYPLPGYSTS